MLREYKTFVAVAREGSFTGAGRQLGLTQSAVSAQIHRLEDHLGLSLFDRSAKAAVLNTQGRELLPQAEALLAMADRMVSQAGGRVSGVLRMGAIASVQQDLLVRALQPFRATYPDVRIRVVPGVSLSLLGQVDAGEVDLVVLIRPPFALPPELDWHLLLSEPMVLAVSKATPLRPWRDLLETEPFIRYDRSSFGGRLVDSFLRRHRITVREAVELDEIDALANMARAGLGVALLPRTRRLDAQGLRLIDLGEPGFTREIGVIGRLSRSPLVEKMVECLGQAVLGQAVLGQAGPEGPAA
ncbi:LysR family transcriptional regulator [Bordetella avium]|uniref:LysR family transcriptional regulator n=1 Tax=Bordetella avium TaxID=521 RepID=UPI000E0A368E|nr:LysR family transcriptional regulator [Bordetella avium]RIQ15401.1 LysR family transcriptional regulator [Bordetella avium]RIQ38490.1 LysR family transcriptional regulator [Bordetella avium]RIQ43029.1 LysR family transcriptional regulator [Bordetella avium]RIQ44036.1 LysR family transcriptional regulator [Bordetella avium]RIQ53049.1 LysR family transcriptional regulator [Bordetella avium]